MTLVIGRNVNSNTEATVTDVYVVSTNSAETIVAVNTNRVYLAITVLTRDCWIRLMPAATDASTRKGIYLLAGQTYELPTDNIYLGEVSVINTQVNRTPNIYTTEF